MLMGRHSRFPHKFTAFPPQATLTHATTAFGKVYLVRKVVGADRGKLFAMKVLKKATIVV